MAENPVEISLGVSSASNASIAVVIYSFKDIGFIAFSPCFSCKSSLKPASRSVSTYGGHSSITLTFVSASWARNETEKVWMAAFVALYTHQNGTGTYANPLDT